MTGVSRVVVAAFAALSVTAAASAEVPRRRIPPAPWHAVESWSVGGSGSTAPLRLRDGRVVVFTRGPSTVVVVDGARGAVRSNALEARPSEEPAPWSDAHGRVAVRCETTLYRVGTDGRVRATAALAAGDLAGVVPRSDGTEVAVVRASDHVDFAALRADGTVAAVRSLAGSSTTEAVGFGRDEVIIGVPRGLAVFDVAGAVRVLPSVDGVTHLARAGDAVFAVTEHAMHRIGDDGALGPPLPLPAPTRGWTTAPDGTALAWIDGPQPTLLRVRPDGSIAARFAAPPFVESLDTDDAGTMVLATRRGRIVALEADGRTRWVVDLQRPIVTSLALGDGDAWVATADGALLHLAPAAETDDAHR